MTKRIFFFRVSYLLIFLLFFAAAAYANQETIIVSAEGLVDPNVLKYKQDEYLLHKDLLKEAKKQAVEKVVALYLTGASLDGNYALIDEKFLDNNIDLVKRLIESSEPILGKDGLMHLPVKVEVFNKKTMEAVKSFAGENNAIGFKKVGNTRIVVSITARDAGGEATSQGSRSDIAENIFKEHMARNGYRVWAEEAVAEVDKKLARRSGSKGNQELAAYYATRIVPDYKVIGAVTFQPVILKMKASGLKIKKYALNSWTVKCLDSISGEELYFNNKIPEPKSWKTRDRALAEIGQMISQEFSKDFFEQQLSSRTSSFQLMVEGLPSYDVAMLLNNELIGLRPVLDVDFQTFDIDGIALYDIRFAGNKKSFSKAVNSGVIKPLNKKLNSRAFQLASVQGSVIRLGFKSEKDENEVIAAFENSPPSSLFVSLAKRSTAISRSKSVAPAAKKLDPNNDYELDKQSELANLTDLANKKNFKNGEIEVPKKSLVEKIGERGRYSALLIGNNEYNEIKSLETPIDDAKAIGKLLTSRYGFKTSILTNATRYQILSALNDLRTQLTEKDSLLIYYAGHGWLDNDTGEGYWLPVDSEDNNPANWLANSSITTILKSMEAGHVLVVSDSCYSGTLTRGIKIILRKPDYFQRIAEKRSRTVLASGGVEPVMDRGGRENHSVFATAFLEALEKNDADYLETSQLFVKVKHTVRVKSDQTPQYSDIRKAGHDGGEFIFVKASNASYIK